MSESETEITSPAKGSPTAVADHVYEHIASAAAAQEPGDTDFSPEAQRLSLMYSESGIIGNMSIVDFDKEKGIGIDTNGDAVADDYLSRIEFGANQNVHTDGMTVDQLNGDIVKIDVDNELATRISRDGDIAQFDIYTNDLLNKKTMQDVPSPVPGETSGTAAYEEIAFDWDYNIWLPWDNHPSATVTDVYGITTDQEIGKSADGYINLRYNDGQSSRFLSPDGDLIMVQDDKHRSVITTDSGLFVLAGNRLLDLVDDPKNSMDKGISPDPAKQNLPYIEPIKGYVVNADNSVIVVHAADGLVEEIG